MKFLKSNTVFNLIVIIFILIAFIPINIGLNGSDKSKSIMYGICAIFILIFIIYDAYRDIIKKQFTTNVYIVFIAIIKIALLGVMFLPIFYNYDKADNWNRLKSNISPTLLILFYCSLSLIGDFVKSERFRKKN